MKVGSISGRFLIGRAFFKNMGTMPTCHAKEVRILKDMIDDESGHFGVV